MPQDRDRLKDLPLNRQMTLEEWRDYVAEKFEVPRSLVRALTSRESGGNINAVGPTTRGGDKARGEMQVMPETAKQYGMNPDDAFDNVYAGVRYLREKFDEAESLKDNETARWGAALAGYHGGGRQIKHINRTGEIASGNDGNGKRKGTETADYVDQIMKRWSDLENGAEDTTPVAQAAQQPVTEQQPQMQPGKVVTDRKGPIREPIKSGWEIPRGPERAQPPVQPDGQQKLASRGPVREPFKSPWELPKQAGFPAQEKAVKPETTRQLHHEKFGAVEEVAKKGNRLVVKDQDGKEHTIQNPRKGNRSATFVKSPFNQPPADIPAFQGIKDKLARDEAFLTKPGSQVSDRKGPLRDTASPFQLKSLPDGSGKPEETSITPLEREYSEKSGLGQAGFELKTGAIQGAGQLVRGAGNITALNSPAQAPLVTAPAALGAIDFLQRKGGAVVEAVKGNVAPAVREIGPWAMRLEGLRTGNPALRAGAEAIEQKYPSDPTDSGQARDAWAKKRSEQLPLFGAADKLDRQAGQRAQAADKVAGIQGNSLRNAVLQGSGQMAVQAPMMFASGAGGPLAVAATVGAQQNWDNPPQALAETLSETMGVGLERKFGPLIEAGIEGRKWSSPALKQVVQNSVDTAFGAVSEGAEELAVGLATEGDIPLKEMIGAGGAAGFATLGSAFGRRLQRRQQAQQNQTPPSSAPSAGVPPTQPRPGGYSTTITPLGPSTPRPSTPAATPPNVQAPTGRATTITKLGETPQAPATQAPVAPTQAASEALSSPPLPVPEDLVIKPGADEAPVTVFGGLVENVDPKAALVPVQLGEQTFFAGYDATEITAEEAAEIALQKLTLHQASLTNAQNKREIIETPVEMPELSEIEDTEVSATPAAEEDIFDNAFDSALPEWARKDVAKLQPAEVKSLMEQLIGHRNKLITTAGDGPEMTATQSMLDNVTGVYDQFRKAGQLPRRTERITEGRVRTNVSTSEPKSLLDSNWRTATDERLAKMIRDAEYIAQKAPGNPKITSIKWELGQALAEQKRRANGEPEYKPSFSGKGPIPQPRTQAPAPVAPVTPVAPAPRQEVEEETTPRGTPLELRGFRGISSEAGLQRSRDAQGAQQYRVDQRDPWSAFERAQELRRYADKFVDLGQVEEARIQRKQAARIEETANEFAIEERMGRLGEEYDARRSGQPVDFTKLPVGALRYDARETQKTIRELTDRLNQTQAGKRAGLENQIKDAKKRLASIFQEADRRGLMPKKQEEKPAEKPIETAQEPVTEEAAPQEQPETKAETKAAPTLQETLTGVITALEQGGGQVELSSLPEYAKTLLESGALEEVSPGVVRLTREDTPEEAQEEPVEESKQAQPATNPPARETAPKETQEKKQEPAKNVLVTDERAAELKRKLKEKLRAGATGEQLNAGIDPEAISLAVELAVYYLERGVREFGAWAKKLVEEIGEEIRPYLRLIYEGARSYAGFDSSGMTPKDQIGVRREQKSDSTGSVGTDSPPVVERKPSKEVQGPEAIGDAGTSLEPAGGSSDGVLARPDGSGVRRGSSKADGDGGVRLPRTGERDGSSTEGTVDKRPGKRSEDSKPDVEVAGKPSADKGGVQSEPSQTEVDNPVPVNIPAVDYRIEESEFDSLYPTGDAKKLEANLEALRLVKRLKEEGRVRATSAEQKVLSQYTGWGQFKSVFDQYTRTGQKYDNQRRELRELLTPEEYGEAVRSSANAHYTAPEIVKAMWDIVSRLGFKGGRVLETSVGTGNFFGVMPTEIKAQSKLTGVEKDASTAAISQYLYPSANIRHQPFEQFVVPDGFYDLAISNVPFGESKPFERRYVKHKARIHDFFFLKALDKVRPGGLVAFITSTGTMDKKSQEIREAIAGKADLVAAIRLPKDTFRKNAGTSVVTDIVILQKRLPGQPANDIKWLELDTVPDPMGGRPIPVNQYFAKNLDQVIGTLDRTGEMYQSDDKSVTRPADFEERFKKAIGRVPKDIYQPKISEAFTPEKIVDAEATTGKEGSHEIRNGKLYRVEGKTLVELPTKPKDVAIAQKMLSIRDAMSEVLSAQVQKKPASEIQDKRTALYDQWQAFVKEHGPLHKRTNRGILKGDPDLPRILAAERYDEKSSVAVPADITLSIQDDRTPSTPQDAIFLSIAKFNRLDLPWMIEQLKTSEAELIKAFRDGGLAFDDPSLNSWIPASQYLSGNVRKKLVEATEAAKADSQYEPNVKELQANQPTDVPFTDIGVRIGSPWVAPSDYQKFLSDLVGGYGEAFKVDYNETLALWSFDFAENQYGRRMKNSSTARGYEVGRYTLPGLMESAAAGKPATVRKPDPNDDKKTIVDEEATALAQAKVADLQENFQDWIWKDQERRERLHRVYNDTHNNLRENPYDPQHYLDPSDSQYRLPGMSKGAALDRHQASFVYRAVTLGRAYAAHEVGTGKTRTAIATAMEWRRLGLAKKPLIATRKKILPGMASESRQVYPAARLLDTVDAFDAANRKRTTAQIAANDWDAVLMTHEQLQKLQVLPETKQAFYQYKMDQIEEALIAAKAQAEANNEDDDNGYGRRRQSSTKRGVVGELTKAQERMQTKLDEALQESRQDDAVYFEELGVDGLIIDEAQAFKNLPIASTRQGMKGLPSAESQRSLDMEMRTWLMYRMNGDRANIVFATGTPLSNSLAEAWVMQQFIQKPELVERGLDKFDGWANTFANEQATVEYQINGDYKPVTRFNKFINIPELQQLVRQHFDVVFASDVPRIVRPEKLQKIVEVEMTEDQQDYLYDIRDRADALKTGKVDPKEDNILKLNTHARLMALDPRMVMAVNDQVVDTKLDRVTTEVTRILEAHPGTTQLIALDLGVNTNDYGFQAYRELIEKLVKAGVPREKIANFGNASDTKAQEYIGKLQTGDMWIALGSSDKVGIGLNIQQKLKALHHVDISYTPDKKTQRDGRIWRQGNSNKEVEIIFYVTKGSFDTAMWQMVEAKQKFFDDFMRGEKVSRDITDETADGDITPAQIKAVASGDPEFITRVALDDKIRQLERGAVNHRREQAEAQALIPALERNIETSKESVKVFKEDADFVASQSDEEKKGKFKVDGKEFDNATEAGQRLFEMLPQVPWERPLKFGEYRGFDILGSRDSLGGRYWVQREGRPSQAQYPWSLNAESVQGTVQSIRLAIDKPAHRIKSEEAIIQGLENDLEKAVAKSKDPYRRADELVEKKAERAALVERMSRRTVIREREDVAADKALLESSGPFPIEISILDRVEEDGKERVKTTLQKVKTLNRKDAERSLALALMTPTKRYGRYRGFDIVRAKSGFMTGQSIALRRPRSAVGHAYNLQEALDARANRDSGGIPEKHRKTLLDLQRLPVLDQLDILIETMPEMMANRIALTSAAESEIITGEGKKPESGIKFALSQKTWLDAIKDWWKNASETITSQQKAGLGRTPDWSGTRLTRVPRNYAEAKRMLADMRFELRKGSGVLYLNRPAMGILVGLADSPIGDVLGGLSVPFFEAVRIIREARAAAKDVADPEVSSRFEQLANVLEEAKRLSIERGNEALVIVDPTGLTSSEVREIVRHEKTHDWQEVMLRSGGFRSTRDAGLVKDDFITGHPLFGKLKKGLNKLGYKGMIANDPQLIGAEAMAFIFSGGGADLGLTKAEQLQFSHDILSEIVKDYGLRALDQFELRVPGNKIRETISNVRKEAGRRSNNGDSAAWSAEGLRPAQPGLRARQESLDRGIPEGRGDEGEGSSERVSGRESGIKGKQGQIGTVDRLGRKAGALMTGANLIQLPFAGKNLLSNAAFAAGRHIERGIQTVTDKAVGAVTGRRYYTTPMSVKKQAQHGKQAFKDVLQDVKTGTHKTGTLDTAYETGDRQFTSGPGKWVEDALAIANFAPDRAFFMAAYEESLDNQRRAQALSPTHTHRGLQEMYAQAIADAQRAIFADKNVFSTFNLALKTFINRVSTLNLSPHFGLADFIGLHYPKVPGGLLARGIEYTPLSFINAIAQVAKSIPQPDPSAPKSFKDRFRQREFVEAFGRGFVGTFFGTGLGFVLSSLGVIIMPDDDKDRYRLEESAGLGSYQINISALKRWATGGFIKGLRGDFSAGKLQQGDYLVNYDWLQPYALMLSMGAALQDAPNRGKGRAQGSAEAAIASVDGALATITDQTVIKNILRVAKAATDKSGYEINQMVTSMPASLVPAIVRQARYYTDPVKRDTRPEHAGDMKEETKNKLKAVIPGQSKQLPARPSVWGKEQHKPENPSILNTMVSPFQVNRYTGDELTAELRRLDLSPADPNRRKGEPTSLLRGREKEAGQRFQAYGRGLVESRTYQNADDAGKAGMLKTLRERILEGAKPDRLQPEQIRQAVRAAEERAAKKL